MAQMVHELRGLLQTIIGYSDLMRRDAVIKGNQQLSEFTEKIWKKSNLLANITNNMAAYFRGEKTARKDVFVDLNVVLDEVVEVIRLNTNKDFAVIKETPLPSKIRGSASIYQMILRNLLQNAVIYCDKKPEIKVSSTQNDLEWIVAIKDNGIGIEPAYAQHIFEPFVRSSQTRNAEGSGLGLSICKKLINTLGGSIRFESALGNGTTFFLSVQKHRTDLT